MQNPTIKPAFRIFDRVAKRMYYPNDPTLGRSIFLTMTGDPVSMRIERTPEGNATFVLRPLQEVDLMPITAMLTHDGKQLYEGDICDMEQVNDFGSAMTARAIVVFDIQHHGHTLRIFHEGAYKHEVVPVQNIRLVGNVCEHPDLDPSKPKAP